MKLTFLSAMAAITCVATSLSAAEDTSTKVMQIVGNDLFVGAWGYGVHILDISNPVHPRWNARSNLREWVKGLRVSGRYAYLASQRGLVVLDVEDSTNPRLAARLDMPGYGESVHVSDHYAYLGIYRRAPGVVPGFRIIDIKDPLQPILLGTAAIHQAASSIDAAASYVFASEPAGGFYVFDAGDPLQPRCVASFEVGGWPLRVQAIENRVFLASAKYGLLVFDISTSGRPSALDPAVVDTNGLPLFVRDGPQIGFLGQLTNSGFRRFHSTNLLLDPQKIAERVRESPCPFYYSRQILEIPGEFWGLHVIGRYALVLGDGLEVIDISDPTRPKVLGKCPVDFGNHVFCDVRAAGHYAYVMDGWSNIHVIDFADPSNPVEVGKFDAHNYASSVLAAKEKRLVPAEGSAQAGPTVPFAVEAPQLVAPQVMPDGSFAFTLKAQSGFTYTVHCSTDLSSWAPLCTNQIPTSGQLRILDPQAATASHIYYRAVRAQ